MIPHTRAGVLRLLAIAAICCPLTAWAQNNGTPIPAEQIKALEEALSGNKEESSAARKRLAVKRMVRDAGELLQAHPGAPNRFEVLALLFRAQQGLVEADNSKENREAFLETCKLLAAAPDEHAALRFDADLLLSQSDMVRKGADTRERAQALMTLVKRYTGTSVELKSIKVAIAMALELGDSQVIADLSDIITERFSTDLDMIAYQREKLGGQVIDAWFSGAFEMADGSVMRFPMDGMGKTTVLCFWSKEGEALTHMQAVAASAKEHQATSYGRIQVVSFNVDNLPDAGESILRGIGVDWPALRLPGGRDNPYYRTFPARDPAFITLSPTGRAALLMSGSWKNSNPAKVDAEAKPDYSRMFTVSIEKEWAGARYTSQLTSLLSGEFLVLDPEGPLDPTLPPEMKAAGAADTQRLARTDASVPEATLRAIQECFLMPPVRYRISNAELKANHEKAEALCAEAIEDHPQAPDLWIVRNRRITALTGLWKLSGDHAFLKRAAAESQRVLESKPPAGSDVVARLCLARESLRTLDAKPKQVIADFLSTLGGDKAAGPALAAASLMAIETGDRKLHEELRRTILDHHAEEPMMWLVVSYILDRDNRYFLYQIPFSAGWSYGRRYRYFLSKGDAEDCKRTFTAELKTMDGGSFQIPKDTAGKWTVVYFMPSEHENPKHYTKNLNGPMRDLDRFIENRSLKDVQTFIAILDDNAPRVKALVDSQPVNQKTITRPVFMVPDGMTNPLVQKLGILSEDEHPNALVLRPDGSIAAMLSKQAAAIPNIITLHDESLVNSALEKGDIEEAKRLALQFAPEAPPVSTDPKKKNIKPAPHETAHLRARARVYMALKDYEKALADAEEVVTRQVGTDGGMSLRTKELDEAEHMRATLRKLCGKPSPTERDDGTSPSPAPDSRQDEP